MVSYGQKNYPVFDSSYSDQIRYVFLKHVSLTGQIKHLHQQHCLRTAYLNPFSLEYSLSREQDGYWHASSLTQRFFCLLRACLLVCLQSFWAKRFAVCFPVVSNCSGLSSREACLKELDKTLLKITCQQKEIEFHWQPQRQKSTESETGSDAALQTSLWKWLCAHLS